MEEPTVSNASKSQTVIGPDCVIDGQIELDSDLVINVPVSICWFGYRMIGGDNINAEISSLYLIVKVAI